ncbi:MAG: hypothetical protein M1833_000443 [Piccolia ochrophora]|nr:MAG: hypothetical protein M1833_000443 [Piccolia ochrophora]
MKSSIVSSVLFYASTYAMAYQGPAPTDRAIDKEALFMGWSPRPTHAPGLKAELVKRAQEPSGVLVGPDSTCAYLEGSAGAAFGCTDPTASSCVYFTLPAGSTGAVGCCGDNQERCTVNMDCVNSAQFSSGLCDNVCRQDAYTLKCTNAASPYCNGVSWASPNVVDYYCDTVSVTGFQRAFTTYHGEDDDRSLSFLSFTLSSTPTRSATSKIAPIESTRTTTSVPTTSSAAPSGKSTPVGAIVGGVVGGLAVLALIAAGVVFLLFRNKKRRNNNGAGVHGTPHYDNSQPPMGAQQHYPPPEQQQYQYNPQHQSMVSSYGSPVQDDKQPSFVSPPGSPPPQQPTPASELHAPMPTYPQPQQQQQYPAAPPPNVHQLE